MRYRLFLDHQEWDRVGTENTYVGEIGGEDLHDALAQVRLSAVEVHGEGRDFLIWERGMVEREYRVQE